MEYELSIYIWEEDGSVFYSVTQEDDGREPFHRAHGQVASLAEAAEEVNKTVTEALFS